jgi:hypothetical protein
MSNRLQKLFETKMTRKGFIKGSFLLFVSSFAIYGVIEQLLSNAATPSGSTEADSGSKTGAATVVANTATPDDKAVEFGAVATSTGTTTTGSSGMKVGICLGSDPAVYNASDGGLSQYQTMKSIGLNMVREECSYNSGNSPSTTAQAALDAGLQVLMLIDAPGQNMPDIGTANFVSFCEAMVNYWKPKGITAYEILNEPNTATNWDGTYVNPAAYAELLKACYSAIKAIDPSATVISGGVATFSDSDGASAGDGNYESTVLPNTWVSLMYEALGGSSTGAFDAVGLHPYTWPAPISSTTGNWSQAFGTSNSARTAMVSNGDTDKSVWITEMGWPTSGTDGDVSDADEASYLGTSLTTAKDLGYISEFIIFNWNDSGDGGFGLVDSSYSQKPAYATVVDFIQSNT